MAELLISNATFIPYAMPMLRTTGSFRCIPQRWALSHGCVVQAGESFVSFFALAVQTKLSVQWHISHEMVGWLHFQTLLKHWWTMGFDSEHLQLPTQIARFHKQHPEQPSRTKTTARTNQQVPGVDNEGPSPRTKEPYRRNPSTHLGGVLRPCVAWTTPVMHPVFCPRPCLFPVTPWTVCLALRRIKFSDWNCYLSYCIWVRTSAVTSSSSSSSSFFFDRNTVIMCYTLRL